MRTNRDYIRANAATTAGEFDSSVYVGGQPPQAVFLRPLHGMPFFGRVVREGVSPAGANYRSVNPHVRALPFDSGKRDSQTLSWSTAMTQALIERRSFPPRPASLTDLPFVADVKVGPRKTARCFWNVPPTADYGHANDVGRQYACDYAQYLKENPFWVGSGQMGRIVQDMHAHECGTATHGYAVGFWAFVEQLLYLATTQHDHYAIAERDAQRYAAIKAAREQEADHA